MRPTLWVLLVLLPTLAFGQSLGEVAKKEKERREKNKREGRKALVISEEELFPEREEGAESDFEGETTSPSATPPRRSVSEDASETNEEDAYTDGDGEIDVPQRIPPDLPMEQRLEMFHVMKRHYDQQVREIDQAIAENVERIRQLDVRIAATSASGGAGLPVAPQQDAATATTQFTGQESESLLAEKQKLEAVNQSMMQRKETLKRDLQTKARVGGIPPGYLRF